jgi:streptogramin lyase
MLAAIAASGWTAQAQDVKPTNDAPNPYQTVKDYFKLPEGRTWGSTSAVDIDKDGKSIWVAERCGGNSCLDRATGKMSDAPTVLKFDAAGKLVKSFGAGLLIFPHGIYVDKDGNIWVTDGQDNAPVPARGAAGAGAGAAGGRGAAPTGPIAGIRSTSSAPTAKCCSRSASRAAPRRPTISISRTTSSSRPTATSSFLRDTAPGTIAF